MKPIQIASFLTVALVAAIIAFAFKKDDAGKGFAVIELFTSEGCSSCPPADNLVAKIEKESKDKPVYILAYHVDYWDRLGWKDVFSNADFSKRQNEYARYLKLKSVYTPQIIANGKTEFVGSEEGTLRNAIKANLQATPTAHLDLSISSAGNGQVHIKYKADGADKQTVLLIAVVEKNAQTKVERGENGGHTLSHVQIVRNLQQFKLTGNDGSVTATLPTGLEPQNSEIIGLLQNTSNGAITGAAKVALGADANTVAAK